VHGLPFLFLPSALSLHIRMCQGTLWGSWGFGCVQATEGLHLSSWMCTPVVLNIQPTNLIFSLYCMKKCAEYAAFPSKPCRPCRVCLLVSMCVGIVVAITVLSCQSWTPKYAYTHVYALKMTPIDGSHWVIVVDKKIRTPWNIIKLYTYM
jgi:hypothetical protein